MFGMLASEFLGVTIWNQDVYNGTGYGKHLQWVLSWALDNTDHETKPWNNPMTLGDGAWAYGKRMLGDLLCLASWVALFPWYGIRIGTYFNNGGNWTNYSYSTAYGTNASNGSIF